MSKIERRPLSVYGLGGRHKLSRFLLGAVWGVLFLSLLILLLVKTGMLVIDGRLLFGSDVFRYALAWIPGFLAIGLFEEYFFRGYLQYTLSRGLAGLYRSGFKANNSRALGLLERGRSRILRLRRRPRLQPRRKPHRTTSARPSPRWSSA